ncbi:hypothetical protein MAJ_11387, partial [Metarhizium majus ARSEF 297]
MAKVDEKGLPDWQLGVLHEQIHFWLTRVDKEIQAGSGDKEGGLSWMRMAGAEEKWQRIPRAVVDRDLLHRWYAMYSEGGNDKQREPADAVLREALDLEFPSLSMYRDGFSEEDEGKFGMRQLGKGQSQAVALFFAFHTLSIVARETGQKAFEQWAQDELCGLLEMIRCKVGGEAKCT